MKVLSSDILITKALLKMTEHVSEIIELDGTRFRHRMISASDVRFHFVEGGVGPTVILLAGFPQSWYAWRRVMPILAPRFNVVAIDLPGQGDSDKPSGGYDTRTTGERIHALIKTLGHNRYFMAGHDIGSWIAYPYAARYPDELTRLVLLDANIPGVTLRSTIQLGFEQNWRTWHFLFNTIPDLPEALLQGRERVLIEWFFQRKTANPAGTFSTADIDEYERVYRKLGNLNGMLGYYRAIFEDMTQNAELAKAKVKTPILALGGDRGSAPDIYEAMKPLCEDVRGGVIKDCGHYIPEEQPEALAAKMIEFFEQDGR
jgi:pimeloyl-ACP methyl ester carboxylesterase